MTSQRHPHAPTTLPIAGSALPGVGRAGVLLGRTHRYPLLPQILA